MDNFYQNPLRTRIWTYLRIICICAALFSSSCGLFESDLNEEIHKTQIVVQLTGELAYDEVATVFVDNELIGTASKVEVATKEVTAGMHRVSATDKDGEVAWSPFLVDVKEKETFTVSFKCSSISFTMEIADKCDEAGGPKYPLHALVLDNKGEFALLNGGSASNSKSDGFGYLNNGFLNIKIRDANNKIWFEEPLKYYQYGSSINAFVSCN